VILLAMALAATPGFHCPEEDFRPRLSVHPTPTIELVLCGRSKTDFKAPAKKKAVAGFKIYRKGDADPIFTSDAKLARFYASSPDGTSILLEEVLSDKANTPFTTTLVTCDSERCAAQKPTCALALPKNPYPQAVKQLQIAIKKGAVDERLLWQLGTEALAGDAAALKFLRSTTLETSVDGSTAEVYAAVVDNITRARDAGCMKSR
jgi:hypothetical protein